MIEMETWEIAKAGKPTLGWEDHGIFVLDVPLDFGGHQQDAVCTFSFRPRSVGDSVYNSVYNASSMEWIGRLMRAFGVDEFSQIQGRTVFVGKRHRMVRGIRPLPTEKGIEFDFDDFNWAELWFGKGQVVDRNGDSLKAAALSL